MSRREARMPASGVERRREYLNGRRRTGARLKAILARMP
jgi:hypothetical protein